MNLVPPFWWLDFSLCPSLSLIKMRRAVRSCHASTSEKSDIFTVFAVWFNDTFSVVSDDQVDVTPLTKRLLLRHLSPTHVALWLIIGQIFAVSWKRERFREKICLVAWRRLAGWIAEKRKDVEGRRRRSEDGTHKVTYEWQTKTSSINHFKWSNARREKQKIKSLKSNFDDTETSLPISSTKRCRIIESRRWESHYGVVHEQRHKTSVLHISCHSLRRRRLSVDSSRDRTHDRPAFFPPSSISNEFV